MQTASQVLYRLLQALVDAWKRQVGPTDFIWLARFRLLTVYVVLKVAVMLTMGVVGISLQAFFRPFPLLLWISAALSISGSVLLLILGLVLASRSWPRWLGLLLLATADLCVISAMFFACALGDLFLLLIVFVSISCTTPIFVERISRYARSFEHSKAELMSIQNKLNELLCQYQQELVAAVESERAALRREIHDRLMQELSASLLQISILLMRHSADDGLRLNATEAARLEASLRRTVTEARSVMQDLKAP